MYAKFQRNPTENNGFSFLIPLLFDPFNLFKRSILENVLKISLFV